MAIKKIRISDQVLQELKRMIEAEKLLPGDRFHSENELTTLLGVSRSSIREAIRLLEVSGIVKVHQGKGIFIADPAQTSQEAFSNWLQENETSVSEVFEMRRIIDSKAAGYAARNAESADIEKLEEICKLFSSRAENENPAEMIKIDEDFHLQLARSTKNRTLYMIMKTMTQSLTEGWVSSLNVPGRIKKSVDEHRVIVEAIRSRDASLAEKKMAEHLDNALREIRLSMENTHGGEL